jgi:hypothetical protein
MFIQRQEDRRKEAEMRGSTNRAAPINMPWRERPAAEEAGANA